MKRGDLVKFEWDRDGCYGCGIIIKHDTHNHLVKILWSETIMHGLIESGYKQAVDGVSDWLPANAVILVQELKNQTI